MVWTTLRNMVIVPAGEFDTAVRAGDGMVLTCKILSSGHGLEVAGRCAVRCSCCAAVSVRAEQTWLRASNDCVESTVTLAAA